MINIIKRNDRKSKQGKYFSYLFLTIFIFSSQIRSGIIGDSLGPLNIVGSVIFLIILYHLRSKFLISNVLVMYIGSCIVLLASLISSYRILDVYKTFVCFILPFILIHLKLDRRIFEEVFKYFINSLNIMIIIITLCAILDIFTEGRVILFISQIVSSRLSSQIISQNYLSSTYRMYSYMGHPLFNTQLYLLFYISNMLYGRYIKKVLPNWLTICITIFGIVMTKSKTGLILLIPTLIFINQKRIKIRSIILLLILIGLLLYIGLFDATLLRFSEGLTTGRSEKWNEVMSNNLYPIKLLSGYGMNFVFTYNQELNWASAAFEYPYKKFALEFGVLATIVIYINILLIPVYRLLKNKNNILLLAFSIIFIDINTYNGLALFNDNMWILCIFTFLLLNIGVLYKNKCSNKINYIERNES